MLFGTFEESKIKSFYWWHSNSVLTEQFFMSISSLKRDAKQPWKWSVQRDPCSLSDWERHIDHAAAAPPRLDIWFALFCIWILKWNATKSLCSVVMEHFAMCSHPTAHSPHRDHFDFLHCRIPYPPPLAEINRRYLTLMWEHYVSCSVETTFVSATGLFALGNCAPLSCKAAWRYSCCREGSEVSGRGATRATWKYKECVVPVCDTFSGPYD